MRKVSTHLNYVVWKCSFCGRKEVLWSGTDPWSAKKRAALEHEADEIERNVAEAVEFNLNEIVEEVLDNIYREHPRSYDEWDEP